MDPSVETLRPPSIEKRKTEAVQQEEDVNGRWTMIFTGATASVAFLQMLLFVWQLSLMRHSVNDSTKAANAAERSARAAVAMELPVIRMIPPEDLVATDVLIGGEGPYGGIVNDGPPTRFSAIGRFEVQNHGRTSAFPTIFSIGWAVAGELPETPKYQKTVRLNHASVIKPNDSYHVDQHYGIEITEQEVAATANKTAWLWVYGSLTYWDFLDDVHDFRFCWRLAQRDPDGEMFMFASDGEPPLKYITGSYLMVRRLSRRCDVAESFMAPLVTSAVKREFNAARCQLRPARTTRRALKIRTFSYAKRLGSRFERH
jgi:hypothetical protein